MDRKFIEKKILSEYFVEIIKDNKRFEIRKDEDNVQVGDILILKEWNGKIFTGREIRKYVTYVLRNAREYGLQDGYCIIGW